MKCDSKREKEAYQNLRTEIEVISQWASNNALIQKVYIYGSRARGDFCKNSDLDVAIGIKPREGDSNTLAIWLCEGKKWSEELDPLLRYKLHLEWYDPWCT